MQEEPERDPGLAAAQALSGQRAATPGSLDDAAEHEGEIEGGRVLPEGLDGRRAGGGDRRADGLARLQQVATEHVRIQASELETEFVDQKAAGGARAADPLEQGVRAAVRRADHSFR